MGQAYAGTRNADTGPALLPDSQHPAPRANVSMLSGHVRHRLILEQELAAAALAAHGYDKAEKFIQEVCWRTYWKGWLEARPSVYAAYEADRDRHFAALVGDKGLRRRYGAAIEGRTGIECFDVWASELVETGYLHNHARMWFASIWVYTLGLPWELGADFFLTHLIDADAASNTLSWRWVVGLHTVGKTYLARRANIQEYTKGRFDPEEPLAKEAPPVPGFANPPPKALPVCQPWPVDGEVGVLLSEEYLYAEGLLSDAGKSADYGKCVAVASVAGVVMPDLRSPYGAGQAASAFTHAALEDSLKEAAELTGRPAVTLDAASLATDMIGWAKSERISTIALAAPSVGWVAKRLEAIEAELAASGLQLIRIRTKWDAAFFPHAKRGFFQLKERIPSVLRAYELLV
jgi:deoxyribodipyrimidine photo-lyase